MSTLQQIDLDSLVGLPLAAARDRITEAGGAVRAVTAGQAITADFRSNRVTLIVEDDRVVRTLGIG